jgi:hypothetical protein
VCRLYESADNEKRGVLEVPLYIYALLWRFAGQENFCLEETVNTTGFLKPPVECKAAESPLETG